MPLYEHVFISRQDLSSAQAEGLVEHFTTILADNGGSVVESEYWGVKTMAYKINKNRKGHYAMLKSDAPAPAVALTPPSASQHVATVSAASARMSTGSEASAALASGWPRAPSAPIASMASAGDAPGSSGAMTTAKRLGSRENSRAAGAAVSACAIARVSRSAERSVCSSRGDAANGASNACHIAGRASKSA